MKPQFQATVPININLFFKADSRASGSYIVAGWPDPLAKHNLKEQQNWFQLTLFNF